MESGLQSLTGCRRVARFLCQAGMQTLVARPLIGDLHPADEWIDIASMGDFHHINHR